MIHEGCTSTGAQSSSGPLSEELRGTATPRESQRCCDFFPLQFETLNTELLQVQTKSVSICWKAEKLWIQNPVYITYS